jgi:hypothetical protein
MPSTDESDSIVVTDVRTDARTDGRRVKYEYDLSPGVRRFFSEEFAVEYDVDVGDVPESLLVVPLVAHLCPVAWATGADVYAPRIDGTFLRSLTNVREGFERLHPEFAKDATVYAKEIVENAESNGEGIENAERNRINFERNRTDFKNNRMDFKSNREREGRKRRNHKYSRGAKRTAVQRRRGLAGVVSSPPRGEPSAGQYPRLRHSGRRDRAVG